MPRVFCIIFLITISCNIIPLDQELEPQHVFLSSQIKPKSRGFEPLAPLPKNTDRLSKQKYYFSTGDDKTKILGPQEQSISAGIKDLRASSITHILLSFSANQTVIIQTKSLTKGSDTVLHLLHNDKEIAFDDDGGNEPGSSKITYSIEQSGTYVIIVRAYNTPDDGFCDLWINGNLYRSKIKFGGSIVPIESNRILSAVLLNDGQAKESWPPSVRASTDSVLLLIDNKTGNLIAVDDDSGVELGSQLVSPYDKQDMAAVVGAYDHDSEGSVRLVVNDVDRWDQDQDGLGDELEKALCLCSSSSKQCDFDCSKIDSPQDTDSDGLTDFQEVLGQNDLDFPQLLPRWGANPRHKDLFVEIDLAKWIDNKENPPVEHFGRTLSTADAHLTADTFAKLTDMQNPDNKEGISLHIDIGQSCGAGSLGIDQVCGNFCAYNIHGSLKCGQSTYVDPKANKREGLSKARQHLFHVAVSDCSIAGRSVVLSDSLEFDCDRVSAMIHELGHNLGLGHYGGDIGGGNCKPNYPSVMNYAYADSFSGNRSLSFSDGSLLGIGDLNPLNIDETKPFGGENAEVGWLASAPYFYSLYECSSFGRGCKIDFNRDNSLDNSVRSYISPMSNYGNICENAHGNASDTENVDSIDATGGPAAAQLNRLQQNGSKAQALYVIAPVSDGDETALWYTYTFENVGKWKSWAKINGPNFHAKTQPIAISMDQEKQIWVFACTDTEKPIHYAVINENNDISSFSKVPGQPSWLRANEVNVSYGHDGLLLIVRDDHSQGQDKIYLSQYTSSGWSNSFDPIKVGGAFFRSTVTPSLTMAPNGRLYMVGGDPNPPIGTGPIGRIHLYSSATEPTEMEDEEINGLRFEDEILYKEHVLWTRPALTFVPHLDGDGNPLPNGRGYLSLWWARGTRLRYLWTWGQLDNTNANFTLGRWHNYEAMGFIELLAYSSPALVKRQNRLSAFFTQSRMFPRQVRHVPYADGIPNEPLVSRDFDDRPIIKKNLCPSLNTQCQDRCKKLTDPCVKQANQKSEEQSCLLPNWQEH